jgi:hypothetical protein
MNLEKNEYEEDQGGARKPILRQKFAQPMNARERRLYLLEK